MELWERIVLGALAVGALVWFMPGAKTMLEESRKAEHRDWQGFLVPVAIVVAFVILLIYLS